MKKAIYSTRNSQLSPLQRDIYSKYKITEKDHCIDCDTDPCYEIPCTIHKAFKRVSRYSNTIYSIEINASTPYLPNERLLVDAYWVKEVENGNC